MISFEGRLTWRRTAPFHVQMELDDLSGRQLPSGEMQVQGRAVRVFRTNGRLTPGDRVEFPLWVCEKGGEPTGPAYIYKDDLAGVRYLEAYLYGAPPRCQLAAYEFCVLETLSDQPRLTPEDLEGVLYGLRRARVG